ncbi:10017_t:CDS:2 [Dentiscutata heterogama]|uniref:10017_t:CDS:1 n=1 Tax=Dentiscutata heterogama TaxID=1316150 RepID=A0ACA9M5X8_9GLOM|nr:10017_t:CDS:2 [Dentiscutata heterogama]
MQSTETKDRNKSKRTTNACIECRNSKKKCDDKKPCTRCTKKDLICETADMCKNCRYRRYVVRGMLYCEYCSEKLGYNLETTQVNANNYDTVSVSEPATPPYEYDYFITTNYYIVEPIQLVDVSLEEYNNTMNSQYVDVPLEEYDNTMDSQYQIFIAL